MKRYFEYEKTLLRVTTRLLTEFRPVIFQKINKIFIMKQKIKHINILALDFIFIKHNYFLNIKLIFHLS